MKRFYQLLGIIAIVSVILALVGCTTYQPVDVTNTMAAQINNIKFHKLEPGEPVKTRFISRTASIVADLNAIEGGVWYRTHQDKIVGIEAVQSEILFLQIKKWRVEYVD
jgi:hypothetical protein